MRRKRLKIGVVAPASRLAPEAADKVMALAARLYGDRAPEIAIHAQCFASSGHFAGDDAQRAAAFVETANDPTIDAVWFARGGYGSNRIIEAALPRLNAAARAKAYLGYSDLGFILAALYGAGFDQVAHGPMVQDVQREGGEIAAARALAAQPKAAAFNITILGAMIGTPLQPDLTDHVLMLEEVSEAIYRVDRSLFHITSNPDIRKVAGIRLGRCGAIPPNDPDFGIDEEAVARLWCKRSGIPWLGRADIGHDVDNKVTPFGGEPQPSR